MRARGQHGSLQKRKRGGVWKWLGLWWAGGSRKTKTLGICAKMSKIQAEEKLAKIVQSVNEQAGATEYSLQGYARDVVFPWYRRRWKPSTAMTTEDRIDHHILRELGHKPLSSFTRQNLQDFLDNKASERPARGKEGDVLSPSTVAHLRWDLQQLFAVAVNDGLLPRNPAELLHTPKKLKGVQRVLSIKELRTLAAALPLREKLIISLAGISGMRPGEILALQWQDLHTDGIHIQRDIYRGVVQTPKTANSVRTAAISKDIREDFKRWRATATNTSPEAWIFPNERGKKPLAHGNYWRRNILPIVKNLKMTGVTFQALRRTAVTLLNEHGADATIVAQQCGHGVDVSINTYNKVGIQRQQDAINRLTTALNQELRPQ